MSPSQRQSDRDRDVARTPVSPGPAQQRSNDQQKSAKIDAAEFWRRLGL